MLNQQPVNQSFNYQMPPDFGGGVADTVIEQPRPTSAQTDPHATRYGYMPPLQNPMVHPRLSGQQGDRLETGKILVFKDFHIRSDSDSLDSPSAEKLYEVTAWEAIENVKIEYGRDDSQRGFVEFEDLAGINDKNLIAGYAYVVNPDFKDINYSCPEGLTACPTCRMRFLTDTFIGDRFNQYERLREAYEHLQPADYSVCINLRDKIVKSNDILLDVYRREWQKITGELEGSKTGQKGSLRYLTEDHHYIRRCLHESAPEERQAQVVTAYGAELASAMSEAQTASNAALVEGIKEAFGSKDAGSDDKFFSLFQIVREQQERQDAFNRQLLEKFTVGANNAPITEHTDALDEQPEPAVKNGIKKQEKK